MKRYGLPEIIVTDKLRSYSAAMKEIGKSRKSRVRNRVIILAEICDSLKRRGHNATCAL